MEKKYKSYRECPVMCRLDTKMKTDKITDGTVSSIVKKTLCTRSKVRARKQVVYPEGLPDFRILAIVGSSGSGKTTLLRTMSEEKGFHFPRKRFNKGTAIVSNFKDREDAISRLSAVGLKSIPTWVKPRDVLSVGEGFRADLALNVEDGVLLDEFTSTVDRNVARSCCTSFGKYIRRSGKKGIVVCSCHKDFIEFLKPDLVMDIDDLKVYDLRGADFDTTIKIDIYRCSDKELWKVFKEHHYMSADINKSCHFYVMRLHDSGDLVGCFSTLPQMTGTAKWRWRVHRTVVLPDYQGLGISSRTLNFFGEYYHKNGRFLGIRTSSIPMLNSLRCNPMWKVGKMVNSAEIDNRKTHRTALGEKLKGKIRDKECATANYLGVNNGKPVVTLVVKHPERQSGKYIDNIEKKAETLVLDNDVVLCWGKVGSFTENERLHDLIGKYRLRHKFRTTLKGTEIKQDGEVVEI